MSERPAWFRGVVEGGKTDHVVDQTDLVATIDEVAHIILDQMDEQQLKNYLSDLLQKISKKYPEPVVVNADLVARETLSVQSLSLSEICRYLMRPNIWDDRMRTIAMIGEAERRLGLANLLQKRGR